MQQRPNINIRFDSKAQVEKIKRAARSKKWSFNQFVIDAAENAAIVAAAAAAFTALGADVETQGRSSGNPQSQ
jgi:uncharacterized protein (DUF1778 family)